MSEYSIAEEFERLNHSRISSMLKSYRYDWQQLFIEMIALMLLGEQNISNACFKLFNDSLANTGTNDEIQTRQNSFNMLYVDAVLECVGKHAEQSPTAYK